jgi:outer membrane protein assembly factor BamA
VFGGQSIAYTKDVAFTFQRMTFQLGDSNFFIGPQFQFTDTNSSFNFSDIDNDIPHRDFESKNSGLGIDFSYDSLDQPFSPTRGIRAEIAYWQYADWLGGDFNYGQVQAYGITYVPLGGPFILGLHLDGTFNIGDAPFYGLPSLDMRGIPTGRYADNNEVLAEAELRYDMTKRWTLVGFGGVGRTGDSVGDLLDADNHFAAGAGFRYLIASEYGLRIGLDVAHADADWSIYVTVGTGWVRP